MAPCRLRFRARANGHALATSATHAATDSLQSLARRVFVQQAVIATLLKDHLHKGPGACGGMGQVLKILEQWMRQNDSFQGSAD